MSASVRQAHAALPEIEDWSEDQLAALRELLTEASELPWFQRSFSRSRAHKLEGPGVARLAERLLELRLVEDRGGSLFARFRINWIGGMFFVTDGAWNLPHGGTYPYQEEAAQLLQYSLISRSRPTTALVDIACGCGHVALAYPASTRRFAMDVDERALAFTRVNAALNSVASVDIIRNDITTSLPAEVEASLGDRPLFLGNLPFSIEPPGGKSIGPIDGGELGIGPTLAAVDSIAKSCRHFEAIFLVNSLGSASGRSWQVLEQVRRRFPELSFNWQLAPDSRVWRVGGEVNQMNPVPLDRALDLRIKHCANANPELAKRYAQLSRRLGNEGWELVGRGFLGVSRP